MRLRSFVNEESPILDQMVKCKKLPEEVQRIDCRMNIYRKYIIKLKKDMANDQSEAVTKDLRERIYNIEAKIKKMKFRMAELHKKKTQTRREGQQGEQK